MARANGMTERARARLHDVEDMSEGMIARSAARAREATKAVRHAAEDVVHQADVARHSVESAITHRPLTSVAIAAGVGFLVARLMR